jgi:phosphatidylserine decarboxylase
MSSEEGDSDSALDDDESGDDDFESPRHDLTDNLKPSVADIPTSPDIMATPIAVTPAVNVTTPTPLSTRSQFTKFLRRPGSKRSASMDSTMLKELHLPASPSTPTLSGSTPSSGAVTPTAGQVRPSVQKTRFRKSWGAKPPTGFNFSAGPNDITGIVMLEIKSAKDLPKLRNSMSHFAALPYHFTIH